MNLVAGGLGTAIAASGVSGLAAVILPPRSRAGVVGIGTAAAGVAGAVAGGAALSGQVWRSALPGLLPLGGVRIEVDALSGWFVLLVGGVAALVGVYTTGYAGRTGAGASSRTALAALPLFVAAMLIVPAAGSVSTLLLAWELMALSSLLLVMTEHTHGPAVRSAGRWYAAMTQAGFVVILLALVWAAAACGGESFAAIRHAAHGLPGTVREGCSCWPRAGSRPSQGWCRLIRGCRARTPRHLAMSRR